MMQYGYNWGFGNGTFPIFFQQNFFWIFPFIIFDIVIKIIALWKAGRNNQLYWFVALAILNTFGIVPIIYLLFFQKNNSKKN